MKKLAFKTLLILSLFATQLGFAQSPPPPHGDFEPPIDDVAMQSKRMEVYNQTMGLTPDEAKKFWSIFNQMQNETEKVKLEEKQLRREVMMKSSSLTDKESEKAVDDFLNFDQQILDIRKKYYQEFKKVVPAKKLILIPKADREFKKILLENFRDKRGKPNRPHGKF